MNGYQGPWPEITSTYIKGVQIQEDKDLEEDVLFADDDDKNKLGVLKHYVSMIYLYVKNI